MKIRAVGVELVHAVGQNVYIMGLIIGNERAICAVLRPERYTE